jgi:hypothetical protein
MTTPTQLVELILRTAAADPVDERDGVVAFRADLADADLRASWLALRAQRPAYLDAVTLKFDGTDLDLADNAAPALGDRFQITLGEAAVAGELRLLFASALARALNRLDDVACVQIGQMGPDETFVTHRSRFQLWTLDPVPPYAPSEPLSDPRALCTDLTGAGIVPADLRPWLLRVAPAHAAAAFEAWRGAASRRLMAALADQVSMAAGQVVYHFAGPPSRSFSLADDVAVGLFERLTVGAGWVFSDGRDVDTRHLLLASEWARSYRPDALSQLGDGSLESARAAYNAYVKSGSRETLKALADLRQAVIAETQKASERAQDLTSGIWKDLAVAAAPFVLEILPESAKAASRLVAGGLAVAAAVFLVYSFSVQAYINHRYFKHQSDARGIWRQALNTVLSQAEIEQFSETPITESLRDYERVRTSVGVFYALLVAILVVFAAYNFTRPPAAAARPTAASSNEAAKSTVPPAAAPMSNAAPGIAKQQ